MKSTVCKQKPRCRLLVTLDSACHSPSLQYQTVCNAHQSHRSAATQSLPERRKRRRGEKEKARTYHLSAVSKTSKSRKLEESMALGQQHSHPLSYIPCKSCFYSASADIGLFNILSSVVGTGVVGEERDLCLLEPGSQFFLWEMQQSEAAEVGVTAL